MPSSEVPGAPLPARALAVARAVLGDALGLVLPVECPGCGRWDVALCTACRASLLGGLGRVEHDVPRLDRTGPGGPVVPPPVWAATSYAGPVRGTVVAWKEHGRADLGRPLAAVLRAGVQPLAAVLGAAARGAPVAVVPVPSSPAARRRRGADLTRLLGGAVVDGLVDGGCPAVLAPVLARRRRSRDQVGLGARARRRNAAGAWVVRAPVAGACHLLVDDVVTTGSTLLGCTDALERAGGAVLGVVVLAATPAPGTRRTSARPG